MIRRTAIALVTLLALVVHGAPAGAGEFDFDSPFRVRGVTTHGLPGDQGGSLTGVLNLDASGNLTSGTLTRRPGGPTGYTGGGLAVANRTVTGMFTTGTSDDDIHVFGTVMSPDVLVFTTVWALSELPPPESLPDDGVDLEMGLAFAVRKGGTYTNDDLTGSTWRFKALSTPVLPAAYGDAGGWAFGSISLAGNRTVTGGSVTGSAGATNAIEAGGLFSITSAGAVAATFTTDGVNANQVTVDGIMSPDKKTIFAIFRLADTSYPTVVNGLVVLQREPAATFTAENLAGTWELVGLDQDAEPNGNVGRSVLGNMTVTGTGAISGGMVTSPGFAGDPSGQLYITPDGFICAGGPFCDNFISLGDPDGNVLSIHAIMSADHSTIVGVYNRFPSDDDETRGLFTLVKHTAAAASTVQFGARKHTRAEGAGVVSLDVVRSGSLANSATVRYTITGGTATAGGDYTAAATRVLTFAAGAASVPLRIAIVQDTIEEASETVRIALSNPTGGMTLGPRSTTVLTITDDDPAGAIAFGAGVYTAPEGGPAAVITVTRTGGTASGVTVRYATRNGTAVAGADYRGRRGTLTFGAGQTSLTFTVPILDDSVAEPVETVNLTLSHTGGGGFLGARTTAVLRILDNSPTIGFTGRWVGNGLEVERTGGANVTSRVDYASVDGAAVAGSDYVGLSGTLTFDPGVRIRIIPITVLKDTEAEGNEDFTVLLSHPVRARLGQTVRQVVIKDNDVGGTVQFSAASYDVTEGGTRTVTVTRTGGAGTSLLVHYFTSDGSATAGNDYVATSGSLLFAVGQTSRTFTVRTRVDESSGTKTVNLNLSVAPGAATLGPREPAILRILPAGGES